MAVRVRFPSGAHDPSWNSREGFLFSAPYIGTGESYLCNKQNHMSHKRTKKEFEEAAKYSYNIAAMCRKPGLRFKPSEEKPISEILVKGSTYQSFKLKRRILKKGLKQHICECCRLSEWQTTPIPL